VSVYDCDFVNNSSPGVELVELTMLSSNSEVIVDSCFFSNNTGAVSGVSFGGLGNAQLLSSLFLGNTGSDGTVRVVPSSLRSVRIENCLLSGNHHNGSGAAVVFGGGDLLRVINTTVVNNTTSSAPGAGLLVSSANEMRVDNSIFWGNLGTGVPRQDSNVFAGPTDDLEINRSILEHLGSDFMPAGVGLIGSDPMFEDLDGADNTPGTSDDNARLTAGSPAIDAGSNLLLSAAVLSDIYGDARFADDAGTADTGVDDGLGIIVDIGAAEFQGTTLIDCVIDFTGDGLLDVFDLFAFLDLYAANAHAADLNGDGQLDVFDVFLFIDIYNAGCV